MKKQFCIFVCVLSLLLSCSVRKHIPPGERLYRGSTIKIERHPETRSSVKALRSDLALAVKPKKNKFLLGQPWKVWWWYKLDGDSATGTEKGLKAFLRNRLGEPPILSSRINTKTTSENMAGLLENLGYFHSSASGDTINTKGYFTEAIYNVQVQPQYTIKNIEWVSDSTDLLKLLQAEQQSERSVLKAGNPYRLSDITSERDRLDLDLKRKGYYFFNPDYLMAYADSSIGGRQVNLLLNLKKTTPDNAKHAYNIEAITIFPNYSLISDQLDTSKAGLEMHDSLYIRDTTKKFKPGLFVRTFTYRPGSVYNSSSQNTTLNRLINLGAFKFVKSRFEVNPDTSAGRNMSVYYYLTPAKKRSIQATIDGFTKDNNYLGTQLSLNLKNRNTFGGAELLNIKAFGGFEISTGDSLRQNNNIRLGGEVSLRTPRYIVPFFKIRENYFYPPSTNFLIGYEMLIKQLFYSKNLFRVQYDLTWKTNVKKTYNLAPVSLSYLLATNITDTFYKQAAVSPSLLLNVYDEAILGTYFTYTYNNTLPNIKNRWYFQGGVDLSGNLYGLVTGAKKFREKKIFGTPFAQYVKLDADFHYTMRLPGVKGWDLANRLLIGYGIPYGNSRLLPFTKQYIIGGPNSLRGFNSRSIGPGTYKPTANDQRFFQIIGGDYKLLFNTELRVPLAPMINGAVFIDAGNIWTKDTLLFGEQGKFKKDFIKEIAVATGIGVRIDATVILIRIDLGIPLRKPYLPEKDRWVFDQINFGSSAWRKENLILNLALGYPF